MLCTTNSVSDDIFCYIFFSTSEDSNASRSESPKYHLLSTSRTKVIKSRKGQTARRMSEEMGDKSTEDVLDVPSHGKGVKFRGQHTVSNHLHEATQPQPANFLSPAVANNWGHPRENHRDQIKPRISLRSVWRLYPSI